MTAPNLPPPLPVFEYTLKDVGDVLFDAIDAVAKTAEEKHRELTSHFHTSIGQPGDMAEHWDWLDSEGDMVFGISIHRKTNKAYLTGKTSSIHARFLSALFDLVDPKVGVVGTQVEQNPYKKF